MRKRARAAGDNAVYTTKQRLEAKRNKARIIALANSTEKPGDRG